MTVCLKSHRSYIVVGRTVETAEHKSLIQTLTLKTKIVASSIPSRHVVGFKNEFVRSSRLLLKSGTHFTPPAAFFCPAWMNARDISAMAAKVGAIMSFVIYNLPL